MRKLAVLSCALTLALAGCGGSSGSGATVSTASTSVHSLAAAANVVTLTVNGGPGGRWVDLPYVSVTVCVPGSAAECQTFNDIELDTGSYGLRLLAGARDTSGNAFGLALPQVTDAGGSPIVECTQFTDGYSWGPVRTADVHIGGESASALPIQVIGDPAYGTVPSACASTGTSENTVAAFGANGLLWVGPLGHDCGAGCLTNAGQNGMASRVTIGVGSAVALLDANPGYTAFNDLGVSGSNQSSFDFGLPFFLGRTVFVAIAGSNTSAGLGPYFAY